MKSELSIKYVVVVLLIEMASVKIMYLKISKTVLIKLVEVDGAMRQLQPHTTTE